MYTSKELMPIKSWVGCLYVIYLWKSNEKDFMMRFFHLNCHGKNKLSIAFNISEKKVLIRKYSDAFCTYK